MTLIRRQLQLFSLFALVVVGIPEVAIAQEGNLNTLISSLNDIVQQLIPLVASMALLGFFYGLAKYIFNAGDEEAQDQGKRVMIGGIIALFLIASIGGIIDFIGNALGIPTSGGEITPPTINTGGGG